MCGVIGERIKNFISIGSMWPRVQTPAPPKNKIK
jgi:hypothetical protein